MPGEQATETGQLHPAEIVWGRLHWRGRRRDDGPRAHVQHRIKQPTELARHRDENQGLGQPNTIPDSRTTLDKTSGRWVSTGHCASAALGPARSRDKTASTVQKQREIWTISYRRVSKNMTTALRPNNSLRAFFLWREITSKMNWKTSVPKTTWFLSGTTSIRQITERISCLYHCAVHWNASFEFGEWFKSISSDAANFFLTWFCTA